MNGSKGLSPAIATIVLIIFAILLGSLVMAFGKDYVENLPADAPKQSTVCVKKISGDPLKDVQLEYIQGKLTRAEYLTKERAIVR